ncbi:MAG: glycosyltransferase family 39 protein [Alphaproteobacteria bacterium]|jgi:4-amino-4-deoxy-L-arabinose transferase-like glycosyltransferase
MSSRPTGVLLLLVYALVFLTPGFFTLPPLDRDESRFAQATKQMLQTGDPVEIRFQDTARNKKPVGIYWMQAASAAALGGPEAAPIWAYRIPSALGALLAIVFTYLAGAALLDRRTAAIGAAILALSMLLVAEGHIAKTDAVMCAAITAMMAGLARAYMRQLGHPGAPGRLSDALLIGGGLGVSALVKGPVGLMVGGLAVLALWAQGGGISWLRRTRPALWLPLALLIVLPWAVAITIQTGWSFWYDAVVGDMLSKAVAGQERHGGFPGYYLLLVTLTLFPASILLLPAGWRAVQMRKAPWAMFLIAWAVPTWIVFEILPTKLPHYVLPAYPALALAIGAYVAARFAGEPDATPRAARIGNLVWWGLMAAALAALMLVAPHEYGGGIAFIDIALALGVLAAAAVFGVVVVSETWRLFLPAAAILAALVYGGLFERTLGGAEDLNVSPRLAAAVRTAGWTPGTPIAAAGYQEPSLVFLTATDIELVGDGAEAAAFLAAHPGGYAIVEGRHRETFDKAAAGLGAAQVATVSGFNYSRGQRVEIAIFRAPAPRSAP